MAMLARQGWRLLEAPDTLCAQVLKVCDLINSVTEQWDEPLLHDIFCAEDVKDILKIPLSGGMADHFAWHPDAKGHFSVRSVYHLGAHL